MIAALADAGAALERADYVAAAVACAEFIDGAMRDAGGRLLRTFNRGRAKLAAYLEDHAYLLEALLGLYEATFDARWFVRGARAGGRDPRALPRRRARRLLLHRRRPRGADRPPQGPRGRADPVRRVGRRLRPAAPRAADRRGPLRGRRAARSAPAAHRRRRSTRSAFGHLLQAIDFQLAPVREVALAGDDLAPLARVVRAAFRPHVVARRRPGRRRAAAGGPRRRSTAAPPPTSASTSPAGVRSQSRRSCAFYSGTRRAPPAGSSSWCS